MRYMIIDDDPSIRNQIEYIIHDAKLGKVIHKGENGTCISNFNPMEHGVDIILLDLIMPVQEGLETLSQLNAMKYEGKVIMISQVRDKEWVGQAYSHGVEYYIHKPLHSSEIINVLKKTIEKINLIKMEEQIRYNQWLSTITPTELKIRDLINKGYTQSQIADELFVSIKTIKNHITNILRKTSGNSSKDVAEKARKMKLIWGSYR